MRDGEYASWIYICVYTMQLCIYVCTLVHSSDFLAHHNYIKCTLVTVGTF